MSTLPQRFTKKFTSRADGCWIWIGCTTRRVNGYGQICVNGRMVLAHRFAYEQTRGAIPPGMQLDHLCRNRLCVNPDHLEAVTPSINSRRGHTTAAILARRRAVTGECIHGHVLATVGMTKRGECRQCSREWNERSYRRRHRGEAIPSRLNWIKDSQFGKEE